MNAVWMHYEIRCGARMGEDVSFGVPVPGAGHNLPYRCLSDDHAY